MSKQSAQTTIVPAEKIEQKIFLIRSKKVMLDKDLAELYGVTTGNLNKAVKRNTDRFPEDFMFQLNKKEFESLIFHFGTSKKARKGGTRKLPYAFTEQGVAMLSSVLNSKRAVQINIQIIKTFVRMREMIISNKELRQRLDQMEEKYDKQFRIVFSALRKILTPPTEQPEPERQMGFRPNIKNLKNQSWQTTPRRWIVFKLKDGRTRAALIQTKEDRRYHKSRQDILASVEVTAFNRNEAWHKAQPLLNKDK